MIVEVETEAQKKELECRTKANGLGNRRGTGPCSPNYRFTSCATLFTVSN